MNIKKYQVLVSGIDFNEKVALFSDLHFNEKTKIEKLDKILGNLKKINPNYICIPGDLLDSTDINEEYLSTLYILIEKLALISPVIISIGNHDVMQKDQNSNWVYGDSKIIFDKISSFNNVYVLDNDYVDFENISFSGHTMPFDYYEVFHESEECFINAVTSNETEKIMKKMEKSNYKISLFHSPDKLYNKIVLDKTAIHSHTDLFLSGHMHGGIIPTIVETLFKRYGLISPTKKLFPNNVRGYVSEGICKGIITTGITKLNLPFVDKLLEPEIVEITIESKQKHL